MTSTSTQTIAAPWTVDADQWPDVAVAAGSRARAAIARAVFTTAAARLPLRVKLPDGRLVGTGGPAAPVMVLRRPREFFRRFGASGLIGFGESYMAGDWDSADLTGLLAVFAAHADELVPTWLQRLRPLAVRRQPPDDLQTIAGARRNIGRHYDLSNDLFALFLDETMTYSSAPVRPKPAAFPSRRRTCSQRPSGARSTGCSTGPGWAQAAGCSRSAPAGASWPSGPRAGAPRCAASPSPGSSRRWPPSRVAEAGLAGRVSVELRDYRDVDGEFDAICSVEMLEAVGERYWETYFAALDRYLAPGGRIGLQTITMPHDRMLATRHTYTWIQKYIFPGGLIPSITGIEDSLTAATRLRITASEDFGAHYAETLKIWREQFGAHATEVAGLGFDEVFNRMWKFYLCYSEAGFRAGYIGVSQLTLARI